MTMHAYVDYNEDTGEYIAARLVVGKSTHKWQTGHPIRDWYEMMQFAKNIHGLLIYSSSLTHFLWDVPGYRTVERADGEYIVWDDRDGDPSQQDAYWSNGIVSGFDANHDEGGSWLDSCN